MDTQLLAHPSVKLWSKARIQAIQGDDSGVTSVEVLLMGQKTTQTLPVEGAFIYLPGCQTDTDFLGGQIELKPDGGVKVDEMMQTNIPGVWAIGDIRNTPLSRRWSRLGTVASRWTSTDT